MYPCLAHRCRQELIEMEQSYSMNDVHVGGSIHLRCARATVEWTLTILFHMTSPSTCWFVCNKQDVSEYGDNHCVHSCTLPSTICLYPISVLTVVVDLNSLKVIRQSGSQSLVFGISWGPILATWPAQRCLLSLIILATLGSLSNTVISAECFQLRG